MADPVILSGGEASLRRCLYGERNGVVADTMRRLGLCYKENWGVGLPAIRRIARETRSDILSAPSSSLQGTACRESQPGSLHIWAKELYKSDLRELRIAALHLADPANLRIEPTWQEQADTPELSAELAFVLRSARE